MRGIRFDSSHSLPVDPSFRKCFGDGMLEYLEPRIAPATINAGGIDSSTPAPDSVNFTQGQSPGGTTPFVLASASPDAKIATLFAGSSSNYYLQLQTKDTLNLFNVGDGYAPWITVNAGRAIAFFNDINTNGILESNELTGLSVTNGASVVLSSIGSLNGDLLVNLNAASKLDPTDTGFNANALVADGAIKSLSIGASVNGNIYSAGAITGVKITGTVGTIGNGTATSAQAYNLGGTSGFGDGTLDVFAPAVKKAGASISNVTVGSLNSLIASDGGAGGTGGSISNLTVVGDTNGFLVQAGNGGAGIVSSTSGGIGGKISNIVVYGTLDSSQGDAITINGGMGGDAFGGSTGKGGVGGSVDKIYIGYQNQSSKLVKSEDFLSDRVYINGGDGGDGQSAGAGGAITNSNIRVAPSDSVLGAEVGLQGGNGGNASGTGKSGNGGAVNTYFIVDNYHEILNPLSGVSVNGGDGGSGGAGAGIGGSVINGTVLAKIIDVSAGAGGTADKTGGGGGSITTLNISFPGDSKLIQNGQQESNVANIYTEQVSVTAGDGGDSLVSGNGGIGGSIAGILAPQTDLTALSINAGDGGSAVLGSGGKGGVLSNTHFDSDLSTSNEVSASISSGDGGNGAKTAGLGGDILASSFILTEANITAKSGDGGDASAGSGASGGGINGLVLVSTGTVLGSLGTADMTSGSGGDGAVKGNGGNGGVIQNSTARSPGNAFITSGDGGDGVGGSVGNGGNILNVFLQAGDTTSNAALTAGDAGGGTTPTKGGNGGAILGASNTVYGGNDVAVQAGDGSFGGIGGDIKLLNVRGFNNLAPTGDVLVAAGQGSNGSKAGGKGGSLLSVTSDVSRSGGTSTFTAGDGGDGAAGNGGAGGAITTLSIISGSADFSVVAGSGGNASTTGSGGAGGSVSAISVLGDVIMQAVAAGDGGTSGAGKGGIGGSVSNVNTLDDIGIRTGADYGFASMGGIFAGVGGNGAANGSVSAITAQSISSIVAGRAASPQLVSVVSNVILSGNTTLLTDVDGSFSNADTANFIGGVSDPDAANADQFHYVGGSFTNAENPWTPGTVPLDGLVAALVFNNSRNVGANAWLQQTSTGDLQLVSLYNT